MHSFILLISERTDIFKEFQFMWRDMRDRFFEQNDKEKAKKEYNNNSNNIKPTANNWHQKQKQKQAYRIRVVLVIWRWHRCWRWSFDQLKDS